jgi:hypothetical protein
MSTYKVQDNSINGVGAIVELLQHFFPYAQEQLGFHKPVMISFDSDEDNASKMLGRTAHYNPDSFSIAVYVDGRHPKDILRSLSHELVHHTQNCNGDFDSAAELGQGYAQENPAMRNAELDAYKRGNIIFRDFEDLIKKGAINVDIDFENTGEPKMSLKEWKNNELNTLLMKKWGLLKEGHGVSYRDDEDDDDAEKEMDEGCPAAMDHVEGGEAIDISRPGMEVHVDDISELSPEEAFAAGIAAARDALDAALGGDVPEDLQEGPEADRLSRAISEPSAEPEAEPAGPDRLGGDDDTTWRKEDKPSQKESITLEQARDVARKIFERLNEAESAVLHNPLIDLEAAAPAWSGRQAELAAAEKAAAKAAAQQAAADAAEAKARAEIARMALSHEVAAIDPSKHNRHAAQRAGRYGESRLNIHDWRDGIRPAGWSDWDEKKLMKAVDDRAAKMWAQEQAWKASGMAGSAHDIYAPLRSFERGSKRAGRAGLVGATGVAANLAAAELGARTDLLPTKSSGEGYGIEDIPLAFGGVGSTEADISGLQASPEVKWNPYRSDTWNIAQGRDPEDK